MTDDGWPSGNSDPVKIRRSLINRLGPGIGWEVLWWTDVERVDDFVKQVIEVVKGHHAQSATQLVPEFYSGTKALATFLIEPIGELEDLVDKESQQIEQEEGHGRVIVAVAEVMFDVIALVFKGIEAFIFYFPSGAARLDEFSHVVIGNGHVGDPAVVVGAFAFDHKAVFGRGFRQTFGAVKFFGAKVLASIDCQQVAGIQEPEQIKVSAALQDVQ